MESKVYSINPIKKIVKRNEQVVEFNPEKIYDAIRKAGEATGEFNSDTARTLMFKVLTLIYSIFHENLPQVEDVQDLVEEVLLASPYKKTAKAYIIYREQHSKIREIASRSNVGLVEQYLHQADWKVNENSNMSYSLQGLNNYISSEVSKIYWLNKIYPPAVKNAHSSGDFHIHDLGLLSVYCVGWDLYDLLISGFQGASGKVESKPACHLRSALGQIVNFFYTLQGEAAGAQAFSNFDTLLAPFIRFDKLSYKDVKQSLQEFLFNLNVPTRVGFQTPFTNLTMDLTVPSYLAEQGVVIGGKISNITYKEFRKEMDIFNKAFLEVMLEGDAKGRVFTFPIPTYNITGDFDWDNETVDMLMEMTAKYGVPYFANFVKSDMKPEDARSMCCRLRIDNRLLERRGGGLFGSSPLTGSIGVVTINMPRLGYNSDNEKMFFSQLKSLMVLAKESLEIKRKVLESFTESGLYPYIKFYLRNIKKRFGLYWKNHFSTIGLIGMNEACQNFLKQDITTQDGRLFTLKVLEFMRVTLIEFQKETGNNYNLEATPAEGTSYRFALLDKEKFPEIKSANDFVNDEMLSSPFYTNSSQLPVNHTDDFFGILDHQEEIQALYTGGTVQHLFICEKINNIHGLKKLIKTICTKYKIPYFSITPTFSVCPVCGYIPGEFDNCPKCSNNCEVYSRIVGYLRPVSQWNKGKKTEFKLRKTLTI